tara:strand:- start:655 stop:1122 length:468 start_codon:yes stop_codon:yes gene_type:complete
VRLSVLIRPWAYRPLFLPQTPSVSLPCPSSLFPPGLVDLVLLSDPNLGFRDDLLGTTLHRGTSEKQTLKYRRQISLLWAIRMSLIVAAAFVATSSGLGYGPTFWGLLGGAGALYGVGYLISRRAVLSFEKEATKPSTLVFLLSYLSVINWLFGLP